MQSLVSPCWSRSFGQPFFLKVFWIFLSNNETLSTGRHIQHGRLKMVVAKLDELLWLYIHYGRYLAQIEEMPSSNFRYW